MNEDKEDNPEWARLIYRNHIDGIEAVKRRQWAATNYILLIFAAIIGYVKLFNQSNIEDGVALGLLILAFVVSIFGIYHLLDMHLVLVKYRKKLSNIREEYKFVKRIDKIDKDDTNFFNYFSITVFFIALVCVGLILVALFLNNSVENYLSCCSIICWITFFLFIDIIISSLLTYKKFKAWEEKIW